MVGLLPVSQIPEDTGRSVVMFQSLTLELLGHLEADGGKSREGSGDGTLMVSFPRALSLGRFAQNVS